MEKQDISIKEEIVKKILSGKFLLTIIAGVVFAYAVITKMLEATEIATILTMVFVSYFQKKEEK